MQVLNEQKRETILSAAAALFAANPFHKVLLSDVAKAASVGKGTLYIYFSGKEHLYISVLYRGFSQLVDQLKDQLRANRVDPYKNIKVIIRELVTYAFQNPYFFEMLRSARIRMTKQPGWNRKREELYQLIQSIIEKGVAMGRFEDPHPELTARFIPGLVRSALLDGTDKIDAKALNDHILRFIEAGLKKNGGPA